MRYRTAAPLLLSMNNMNNELIENFLKSNPDIVLDFLKKNKSFVRPETQNGLSQSTYYREKFALELKPVLDAMLKDRQNRIFRYSNYRTMQPASLRVRIEQAWSYINRFMDPDNVYKNLRAEVDIRRGENGIIISIIDENKITPMIADQVEEVEIDDHWKNRVDKFLADAAEGEKLTIKNIDLTENDLMFLETSFHGLTNIVHSYDEKRLIVLKLAPKDVEKIKSGV